MGIGLTLILLPLAAIVYGFRKRNRAGSIAAAIAFPVLLTGVYLVNRRLSDDGFVKRDSDYFASQGARIGSELKERGIGGEAAVLVLTGDEASPEVGEFCRRLREFGGFDRVEIRALRIAHPSSLRLCDRADPADFEAACGENPDSKVIISLAGVPGNFRRLKFFQNVPARPFVAVCPEKMPLERELARGVILAAVFPREDAVFRTEPVADSLAAFSERYRFVAGDAGTGAAL